MTFWSLYRILRARRAWLLLLTVVCLVAIFIGLEFQRKTAIIPVEATLSVLSNPSSSLSPTDIVAGVENRVSAEYQAMQSSDSIYETASSLMSLGRSDRSKRVLQILEKTKYFAAIDLDYMQEKETRATLRARHRDVADQISSPRDASGVFAEAGIAGPLDGIITELRRRVTISVNESIHSADANRKFDPVIRLEGAFARPAEGMLAVNMLAVAALLQADLASRQTSSARLERIGTQRTLIQTQLDRAYAQLIKFRSRSSINARTGLPGDQTFIRYQALEQDEQKLRTQLASATQRVEAFRDAISNVSKIDKATLPASESVLVQQAELRVSQAKSIFSVLGRSNLGVRSDEYLTAESELIAAREALDVAKSKPQTLSRWNTRYDEFAVRLADAEADRSGLRESLTTVITQRAAFEKLWSKSPAANAGYENINRQIKVLDERLLKIEQELTLAQTEAATEVPVMSLQSQAHMLPVEVVNRWKIMLYGLALSLLVASTIAIISAKLDDTIQTGADLQREMDATLLGTIPVHFGDAIEGGRVVINDPTSAISEAFRLLRTNLQLCQLEQSYKALLVIGIRPADGTSTVASNVAIALAQTGRRVLLIDADLRRPVQHIIFGANLNAGVTSVIGGSFSLEAALQPTSQTNLTLLPAGPAANLPSEILSSVRMGRLLIDLKSQFDLIIIDAPAPIAFADALVVASQVDAVMLVSKAGNSPRGLEQNVRSMLVRTQARILGVVLNQVKATRVDSSYYQDKYYANDYGSGSVTTASEL